MENKVPTWAFPAVINHYNLSQKEKIDNFVFWFFFLSFSMHTRRHTEPLITFGKSISLFTQGLNTLSVWDSLHGLEPTDWWCLRFYVHTTGKRCDWGIQSLWCCQTKTSVIDCPAIPKTLQQLHTEHCNMTGNAELWQSPQSSRSSE